MYNAGPEAQSEITLGLNPKWIDQIKGRYPDKFASFGTYQALIRQEEQYDKQGGFFVILTGSVDIINTRLDTIEHTLLAPTFVGEIRSLNPDLRASRTVRAHGDVTAIQLSPNDLRSWNFEGYPWRSIYEFIRKLSEVRFHQLPEVDQTAAGFHSRGNLRGNLI